MISFSIIIPVYNAEKTLKRCLDSIIHQSYSGFEAIMINDGSVDASGQICRVYADKDSRFFYLEQENSGPSAARNLGLDRASGEYIFFLDADDYLETDALQRVLSEFNKNADVVFFAYNQVDASEKILARKVPLITAVTLHDQLEQLSDQDMFGYTWIKSIRRDKIGDIRFHKDLNLFEDEVFICEVLAECERIACCTEPVINYFVNNVDALMGKTYQDYCYKTNQVFLAWKKLFQSKGWSGEYLHKKADHAIETCRYYYLERDVDEIKFLEELKNTDFINQGNSSCDFVQMLMNRQFKKLLFIKKEYKLKNRMANWLHRR